MNILKIDNGKIDKINNISLEIIEGETVIIYSNNNLERIFLDVFHLDKKLENGELYYVENIINDFDKNDINEYQLNDCVLINNESMYIEELNVIENIKITRELNNIYVDEEYFNDLIKIFSLENDLFKNINEIDKYTLLKVKIVRLLLVKPFIVLLDNIVRGLNNENKIDLIEKMNTISSIYKTTIIHGTNDSSLFKYGTKTIIIEEDSVSVQ